MSDDKPQAEFIDNPNPIAKKARVNHGKDPKQLIAKADAAEEAEREFEDIFAADIAKLSNAMAEIKGGRR